MNGNVDVLGKFNLLEIWNHERFLEKLEVEPDWVGERLTVFDTGISHHSGMVNGQVIRRRLDRKSDTIEALESIDVIRIKSL